MNLKLSDIRTDGGTQSRVQLDAFVIDEYARAMMAGAQFPPVVAFYDGADYWLADGFHRLVAARDYVKTEDIPVDVRQGTVRDAILYSVGANAEHGKQRTNEDKRNAVKMLLNDAEWGLWTDNEIAKRCRVSHTFVAKQRPEILTCNVASENGNGSKKRKTRNKHGGISEIDTTNIGKPKPKSAHRPSFDDVQAAAPTENASQSDEEILDNQAGGTEGYDWTQDPQPTPEQPTASTITIHNTDAQNLHLLDIAPVHLVITSPPYNVGIDYNSYNDDLLTYLPLLTSVWSQCYNVMTEGARIAVVVPFGVGRNPWVPMACKVMETLTAAGFTLRGQIIWDKNTTGNRTSWGSWRLPSNPSLRDTTEVIIVAHKGDGKLEIPESAKLQDDKGTYSPWLMNGDYFMELAQDHWAVTPESAQRIGHPAPFPVELVKRLIHFYAYPGAHILDPFAGSGTVGKTAKELGCDATLIEIDKDYCDMAKERCK